MRKINEEKYEAWLNENKKRRSAQTLFEYMDVLIEGENEHEEEEQDITIREHLEDVLDETVDGFSFIYFKNKETYEDGYNISMSTRVWQMDNIHRMQAAVELLNSTMPDGYKIDNEAVNSQEKVEIFSFLVQKISKEML